jgi:hypothetical protein
VYCVSFGLEQVQEAKGGTGKKEGDSEGKVGCQSGKEVIHPTGHGCWLA